MSKRTKLTIEEKLRNLVIRSRRTTSGYELAKRAGVSRALVKQLVDTPGRHIRLDSAVGLADALGYELSLTKKK